MRTALFICFSLFLFSCKQSARHALVFQTDFGQKDGAVSAMKGVAFGISADLPIYDLTHEIPPFNIWEAAYRLEQTSRYWPEGTVFVSVVDPGVGSERKSVVLKTNTGHYFVTPDNGTLTLVAASMGIAEVREIDEAVNRRRGSGQSYTFHGRDVYAYTGARLAAGVIKFEEVGPKLPADVVRIAFAGAARLADGTLTGGIPVLDIQYGNVWTNIGDSTFKQLQVKAGDLLDVTFEKAGSFICRDTIPFVTTFAAVPEGAELAYLNSLMNLSFAINQGSFSDAHQVLSGPDWNVAIKKLNPVK
ncbi:S-adenosyl-l-methionine hydroxide adenosyltransferase family protein [Chitinophaga horti]|uniref:S-adenosyl-l-methionine hydroxide adenosyltransferase family protein n=1 Tax=Chitinophaga horti TaxID=2920382 RepID=A0ABY6IX08_9BACT|nr:S-adenosyl-l-methionine hydroxide adenosyltransferase family protein [Chitinophaga horti]UYQ91917.1 S-adenosyl-l-methionine hydroxide adenosyltransferase family protein [Chitinophaga horti]